MAVVAAAERPRAAAFVEQPQAGDVAEQPPRAVHSALVRDVRAVGGVADKRFGYAMGIVIGNSLDTVAAQLAFIDRQFPFLTAAQRTAMKRAFVEDGDRLLSGVPAPSVASAQSAGERRSP